MEAHLQAVSWEGLPSPLKVESFKYLMKEGARFARDAILHHDLSSRLGRIILYRSIARAAHSGARAVLGYDVRSGRLWLLDPDKFAADLDQLQTADLEAQHNSIKENLKEETPERLRCKRRQMLRRLQKRAAIWAPFDRRLHLKGIRLGEEVATTPESMSAAICSYWGDVFGPKQ
eukprot:9209811-Pyramimonas_sp.AAC.1